MKIGTKKELKIRHEIDEFYLKMRDKLAKESRDIDFNSWEMRHNINSKIDELQTWIWARV